MAKCRKKRGVLLRAFRSDGGVPSFPQVSAVVNPEKAVAQAVVDRVLVFGPGARR